MYLYNTIHTTVYALTSASLQLLDVYRIKCTNVKIYIHILYIVYAAEFIIDIHTLFMLTRQYSLLCAIKKHYVLVSHPKYDRFSAFYIIFILRCAPKMYLFKNSDVD